MPGYDKARIIEELRATSDGFLRSIEGVTPAQWAWTPAPERWSVGLTAEHVTIVLRGVGRMLATTLLTLPIPEGGCSPLTDEQIARRLFDRSRGVPAPEVAVPRGRWATPGACEAEFRTARDEMVRWLEAATEDLRRYGAPHPLLGTLNGMQWLVFVAAHTERHTRQIDETRETTGFPAGR